MEWVKVLIPGIPLVLDTLKSITKHVAYPFKVSSNLNSLKSEIEELQAMKNDVQTSIMNAQRVNGEPTEQISHWLKNVEAIEQKANTINENHEQLFRCLWNIPPNLWSNYKISKNAAKKQVEVKNLQEKRAKITNVTVQMAPPLVQESLASTSKTSNLELALQYISDNEYNIIGIWGMGGVGKTHLLEQISYELCKARKFEVVKAFTCSKDCSVEKIQNKIIKMLGLTDSDDEEIRKNTILNFLNKKSFILLLDDLWNRIDLKQIGISDLSDKRKVVLTTRSIEVCRQMDARKRIKVDVLNSNDAWCLFEENVTKETIYSNRDLKEHATKLIKKLGGLPLALITIGRAMNGETNPESWALATEGLREARLDDVSEESLFPTLSFSYENIKNDTLKQCFLHCALWPEDYFIERNELVELWMGLGLIDVPEMQLAYNVGYENIRKLQALCLLEEAKGLTSEYVGVKMHDVIRDMALWIASEQGKEKYRWIVERGTYMDHKVIPHITETLSPINTRTKEISCYDSCSSNKLLTLLLRNNWLGEAEILSRKKFRDPTYWLGDAKMLWLKSFGELTVLDLSCNNLETFPIEICTLVKLQFLNLSDNDKIKSLPKEFVALINLKYLLLRRMRCTFPKGVLSEMKSLRVLDRIHYDLLYRKTGYIFEIFLSSEKELLLDRIHYDLLYPKTKYSSKIFSSLEEELQRLSKFQVLGISVALTRDDESITDWFLGYSQLQSNITNLYIGGDVNSVKFERANDDHRICRLQRLERLCFEHVLNMAVVVWKSINPKDVFPRLQFVEFNFCNKLENISWVAYLPCIRELKVMACDNIRHLICVCELNNDALMTSQPFLSSLKTVTLCHNEKLESISDPMIILSALDILSIIDCKNLKKLPFKTCEPPKELILHGTEEWWNNIEMDSISHRPILQPFFIKGIDWLDSVGSAFRVSYNMREPHIQ